MRKVLFHFVSGTGTRKSVKFAIWYQQNFFCCLTTLELIGMWNGFWISFPCFLDVFHSTSTKVDRSFLSNVSTFEKSWEMIIRRSLHSSIIKLLQRKLLLLQQIVCGNMLQHMERWQEISDWKSQKIALFNWSDLSYSIKMKPTKKNIGTWKSP